MKDMDGRKLSHEVLEGIRVRAVKCVVAGESPEAVVNALGFHRSAIYKWIALYREGRDEAFKARMAAGAAPNLNGKQLPQLYTIITSNNSLRPRFEFALLTRAVIREVVRERLDVRLSDVSVGCLLRKLGLLPPRPLCRADQRDEEKVEA